jgi:hypothetical protein
MWAVTHVLKSGVLDLLIGLAVLVALLVFAGLIIQAIGTAQSAIINRPTWKPTFCSIGDASHTEWR